MLDSTRCFIVLLVIGLIGCTDGAEPLPVESSSTAAELAGAVSKSSSAQGGAPLLSMSNGVEKVPISGTISFVSESGPEGVVITPSGICHNRPASEGGTYFDGDVEGEVTFRRRVTNSPCAGPEEPGDRLTGAGPFDGEVTFEGDTGMISGQWTTECRPDASEPAGWSCDGTMTARGSGELEGVKFRFNWGPGWFPFPYEGTAIITG